MKRFWPFFLALFCWLLVLVVPTTRQQAFSTWENWPLLKQNSRQATQALIDEYSGDGNFDLYMAARGDIDMYSRNFASDVDLLAKRYPNNLFVARLKISKEFRSLMLKSKPAKLVSKSEAKSSEQSWKDYIALVERYQRLEPQNSYFDWMLLHALYETHQNARAAAVLKAAARKTVFDPHVRDGNQITLDMYKRAYGPALPPIAYFIGLHDMRILDYSIYFSGRRAVLHAAIDDRKRGQHTRALETTVDLLQLSRTMRDASYSLNDTILPQSSIEFALTHSAHRAKLPRLPVTAPLTVYQKDPRSLYAYAKEQKRDDIAAIASAYWSELAKWDNKTVAFADWRARTWPNKNPPLLALLAFTNQLRTTILWTLPLALALCLLFGLAAWRLRIPTPLKPVYCYGAKVGVLLVGLAMIFSGLLAYSTSSGANDKFLEIYISYASLIDQAPVWLLTGIPLILLCLGLSRAGKWQETLNAPPISFLARLRNLKSPSEDGLARFDFGWIVGFVLKLTYFLTVASALITFSLNQDRWDRMFGYRDEVTTKWFMIVALAISLIALLFSWLNRPRRVETLRLSFRTTFQLLAGYIVAASLLYTVATFAILPIHLRVAADYERLVEHGEFQLIRGELGLK